MVFKMLGNKRAGDVKCVIVGDGGVGKTSMLLSYTTGGIMTDYIPTCFDAYTVDLRVMETPYTMSLVDTAGQETYDRLRTLSYYDTDVFIVCFSSADPDSFENIKTKWVPEIRQYRPDTPFILIGTQIDLRGSVVDLTDECITATQGKKAAKRCGAVTYLECSALEGFGIDSVFRRALMAVVAPKKPHLWKRFKSAFHKKTPHSRDYR